MKYFHLWAYFSLFCSQAFSQDFIETKMDDGIQTFASADFNDDGKQDLLGFEFIEEGSANLLLMLNTSNDTISFDKLLLASSPLFNGTPAIGDFDGDEDMDIAFSFSDAEMIVLLRNNGDNTFLQEDLGVSGANRLSFQDLEGDGDMDLIGYTSNETEITAFINDGTGVLSPKIFEHQNDISSVDYGDLDGDGDIDLALSVDKFSGETVAIYLNDSLNNFEKFTAADINALNSALQIKIVDFNRDGKLDLIGMNDKKITAFIQSEIFGFVPQDLIEPNNIGELSVFEIADIDGDGDWDIAIGDLESNLYWYENVGLVFIQRLISDVHPILDLISADFDNDGDIDLVVSNGDFHIYTNEINQMPSFTQTVDNSGLSVSPNPFADRIFIENVTGSKQTVKVFNTIGNLLYSEDLQPGNRYIDLVDLPAGQYFLKVYHKETRAWISEKIVKL